MPVALITGASRGLGRAIARSLGERGWSMVIDARGADALAAVAAELPTARAIVGDVTDSWHRAALADAVESFGGLHLLVNNASHLGPSPQPQLAEYPLADFADVYRGECHRAARVDPAGPARRCSPAAARSSTSAPTRPSRRTPGGVATDRPRPRSTS